MKTKIILNGKEIETVETTAYKLKDKLGKPTDIVILNGFQIEEINPFIKVEVRNVKVTEDNVKELFSGYDIVCEAFDKPDAKAVLVNTALQQLPGIKIVAASGMAGFESSNLIKTTRPMTKLYICGDLEKGAGLGNGLMAPRVMVCAGHQANMVLRLLVGIEEV